MKKIESQIIWINYFSLSFFITVEKEIKFTVEIIKL